MKNPVHFIGLVGLLLLSPVALASAEEDFFSGEALFQKASAGDKGAVEQTVAHFERLAAADTPYTPLYLAYLGAAQAMQGRDAWMPWTKMRATERGLATLDKSLRRLEPRHDTTTMRQVPVAAEVRLVAASTFLAVPGLFHRFDDAKTTLRAALASPSFAAAPSSLRDQLQRRAAEAAARQRTQESGS